MMSFNLYAVTGKQRVLVCQISAYSAGQARYWAPRFARWYGASYQRLSLSRVKA